MHAENPQHTFDFDDPDLATDSPAGPLRARFVIVTPKDHFSSWAYKIRPELWPTFGVELREYIDRPKTKIARKAAIDKGMDRKKAAAEIKIKHLAYSAPIKPTAYFHEGDIFYPAETSAFPAIQVLSIKENIEVHAIVGTRRQAYHIGTTQLMNWIMNGQTPDPKHRIDRWESRHPILHSTIEAWPPG